MPHYELFCHACKQLFSETLSPAANEEGDVVCPYFGSEEWSVSRYDEAIEASVSDRDDPIGSETLSEIAG